MHRSRRVEQRRRLRLWATRLTGEPRLGRPDRRRRGLHAVTGVELASQRPARSVRRQSSGRSSVKPGGRRKVLRLCGSAGVRGRSGQKPPRGTPESWHLYSSKLAAWRPTRRFLSGSAPHSCTGATPCGTRLALRWTCQSSAVVQSGRGASGEHAHLLKSRCIHSCADPASRAADLRWSAPQARPLLHPPAPVRDGSPGEKSGRPLTHLGQQCQELFSIQRAPPAHVLGGSY